MVGLDFRLNRKEQYQFVLFIIIHLSFYSNKPLLEQMASANGLIDQVTSLSAEAVRIGICIGKMFSLKKSVTYFFNLVVNWKARYNDKLF